MLYVPEHPLSSPLFLLLCSLGRIQTKRHLCWLASVPASQTTAAPTPPPALLTHSSRAAWALKINLQQG